MLWKTPVQNIQKTPLREVVQKTIVPNFHLKQEQKTDQRKTPTALTKLSSQKLSTKVFGLSNRYGGYPSPRFNNKHPENDSFIENS